MTPNEKNLLDFLEKAYELTVSAQKCAREENFDELITILDNRERAIAIAQTMSERMSLEHSTQEPETVAKINNQVNQLINKIQSLDESITMYLQAEKSKTQNEIAKTFKNKENFSGYNLNKTDR